MPISPLWSTSASLSSTSGCAKPACNCKLNKGQPCHIIRRSQSLTSRNANFSTLICHKIKMSMTLLFLQKLNALFTLRTRFAVQKNIQTLTCLTRKEWKLVCNTHTVDIPYAGNFSCIYTASGKTNWMPSLLIIN